MVSDSATIPVGYKKTEVGVIPEDWDVKTFGDVGEVKMCRRIFNHETNSVGDIPFYKIGTFGGNPDAYISRDLFNTYRRKFSFPKSGSILISAAGTIGRTVVYGGEDAYFQDSNIIWIQHNEQLISNKFLYHLLDIAEYTTEGGTIQRLYNSILLNTKFLCPPKSEQEYITEVLDDTNLQIDRFEQLIVKLRGIKQGTMQELLTGKTRLTGFSGEWESIQLGELAFIEKGKLITKNQSVHGEVPVIAGGMEPAYFHNVSNRNGKTITISGSGANAGYVSFHKIPIFASDCSTINESSKYSIEFIFFMLQNMQHQIYAEQTGGAQPHIHPSNLNPMQIYIPSEITEQEAIAEVLTDMDAEIAALEQRLEKTKAIKQGMMQQLLTGRIRLVDPSTTKEANA
jgi:type I restriction enzyme S subunit